MLIGVICVHHLENCKLYNPAKLCQMLDYLQIYHLIKSFFFIPTGCLQVIITLLHDKLKQGIHDCWNYISPLGYVLNIIFCRNSESWNCNSSGRNTHTPDWKKTAVLSVEINQIIIPISPSTNKELKACTRSTLPWQVSGVTMAGQKWECPGVHYVTNWKELRLSGIWSHYPHIPLGITQPSLKEYYTKAAGVL